MIIKTFFHDPLMPIEDYVNFIHNAFKERLDQNLNFGCATFSVEIFKEKLKDSHTIIIFSDEGVILGSVTLTILNNRGYVYGWHDYLAVSPTARGKNIGSALECEILKLAEHYNLQFMLSSTAFGAYSSIKFHGKSGFKKIAVKSYGLTNYYSYIFIKPVNHSIGTILLMLFRWPLFIATYISSHLFYQADGSKRF